MAELLLISEVARQARVSIETVRLYERQQLLPPLRVRTSSKYRRYPIGFVQRVRFIQRAGALGLGIGEIRELLSLRDHVGGAAKTRRGALTKATVVVDRIAALERLRAGLIALSRTSGAPADETDCPILAAFESTRTTLAITEERQEKRRRRGHEPRARSPNGASSPG